MRIMTVPRSTSIETRRDARPTVGPAAVVVTDRVRYPFLRCHSLVGAAAALALFVVAIKWGTFAAGGSDSACYLSEARLFARGTTHIEQPLIAAAPWPRAEWSFTPAGHIPSPLRRELIVPICPPGLPLTMAAARWLRAGELLVVPWSGALAVW